MNATLRELSVEARMMLVEDLWDSIAKDRKLLPVTSDQKAELNRRPKAYEIDRNPSRSNADGAQVRVDQTPAETRFSVSGGGIARDRKKVIPRVA